MADGGQILDSKKNVTVNGRVSPVNGQYYSGVTVELIQIKDNTEYVCGSGVTDSNGYYNFTGRAYYVGGFGELYTRVGNDCSSIIDFDNVLEFTVNDSFETYSDTPFTTDNPLIVDYGDGSSLDTYSTGKLSHTYASSGNYNVSIFGAITQLGEYCFDSCTSLTSINLPNSITQLREGCFNECTGLTSINLPNSITQLGAHCFRGCTGLTSINLPNSITQLGAHCFTRCTGLTSINLPNSITQLRNYCFYGCDGLTSIQLNWDSASSIVAYNSTWIDDCSSFDHFLIPQGTTSLYVANGYPSSKLIEEGSIGFDDISVSSTQDVLSYADGDSTVLSAQLTNQGQAVSVSGESVTFEVRKVSDDSLVETLTDTTDSNGLASVEYFGKGTGDLYITARCRTLSKTYSNIEDIRYANIGDTDKSSDFDLANIKVMDNKTKGTVNITHDNNKYTITTTGFGNQGLIPIPKLNGISSNYKFSVIIKNLGGLMVFNTPVVFARVEAPTGREVYSNNWNSPDWHTVGSINTLDSNTEYELQLIGEGSTITVKIFDLNGTLLGNWSTSVSALNPSNTIYLGIWVFNSVSTIRNLKLKLI